jgi:hypothetical protein
MILGVMYRRYVEGEVWIRSGEQWSKMGKSNYFCTRLNRRKGA